MNSPLKQGLSFLFFCLIIEITHSCHHCLRAFSVRIILNHCCLRQSIPCQRTYYIRSKCLSHVTSVAITTIICLTFNHSLQKGIKQFCISHSGGKVNLSLVSQENNSKCSVSCYHYFTDKAFLAFSFPRVSYRVI